MTTLKPGDKVTSPLLVGEWYVWGSGDRASSVTVLGVPFLVVVQRPRSGQAPRAAVPIDTLTPVAPPLPPEPPVGSVVFVDGEGFVNLGGVTPWYSRHRAGAQWADIAATARPAVPQPTVDEMAEALYGSDVEGVTAAERASIIMRALGWEVPGE